MLHPIARGIVGPGFDVRFTAFSEPVFTVAPIREMVSIVGSTEWLPVWPMTWPRSMVADGSTSMHSMSRVSRWHHWLSSSTRHQHVRPCLSSPRAMGCNCPKVLNTHLAERLHVLDGGGAVSGRSTCIELAGFASLTRVGNIERSVALK